MSPTGLMLALALCAGCPGARAPSRSAPTAPSVRVVLVATRGEQPPQLAELVQVLEQRARVERVRPEPRPEPGSQAEAVRAKVKRAREHYLTMKMESAKNELLRALKLARRSQARGLSPRELAEIHLLLAAVSQAQRRSRSMRRYCKAAAGYDPELPPNPDLISPPVRQAFERAREERQSMEVVVRTEPPGASVIWDGVPRGASPARIPDQFKGEHYLIVEHPLYRTWGERILLSTSAALQVKLEPAEPPQLLAAVEANPELARRGVALLGVQAAVWPRQTAQGMQLRVVTARDERSLLLAPASPEATLQSAAASITREGAAAKPTPTSQPAAQPLAANPPPAAGQQPDKKGDQGNMLSRHFRRYWWAWTLVGAGVLSTVIVVPLVLAGDDEVQGRGGVLIWP